MKLYFVRHGKAGALTTTDAARTLTPQGTADTQNTAELLRRMDINLTKIYSSPRVRAHQTAVILGHALRKEPEVTDICNFDFSVSGAMELVRGMPEDAEVMFVGHNPTMSEVVEALTGAAVELSTGAVACVTRVYPPSKGGAILKWLLTPKVVNAFFAGGDSV